jgi:quinol monooxygenase YgiN
MGISVIAAYRPKPGKADELLAVLRDHIPTLRKEQLIADRPAHLMQAKDGTILEVFEWKSREAIDAAHRNPAVAQLWDRFHACCDYGGLADLPEMKEMFPNFEPLNL